MMLDLRIGICMRVRKREETQHLHVHIGCCWHGNYGNEIMDVCWSHRLWTAIYYIHLYTIPPFKQ